MSPQRGAAGVQTCSHRAPQSLLQTAQAAGVLQELRFPISETSLGDNFIAGAVPHRAEPTIVASPSESIQTCEST